MSVAKLYLELKCAIYILYAVIVILTIITLIKMCVLSMNCQIFCNKPEPLA